MTAPLLMMPLLCGAVKFELVGARPEVGTNRFRITLTGQDASHSSPSSTTTHTPTKPTLRATMPAMGTMPSMESLADVAESSSGVYLADLELSMGGTWELTLTLPRQGEASAERVLRYAVTTDVAGVTDKNTSSAGNQPAHEPSTTQAGNTPVLDLGPARVQRMGVRFTEIQSGTMQRSIRTTGTLESDTSQRREVTLRFPAYIKKVSAKQVGDSVKAGDLLAVIESPELAAAQQEVLFALQVARGESKGNEPVQDSASPATARHLHLDPKLGRERLRSLGMTPGEIDALVQSATVSDAIAVRAPISGTVLAISAREGARIESGEVLFLIGDLRRNYVIARVFQPDLPYVKSGQKVVLSVPGFDSRSVEGRVDLVYPTVSTSEGTAEVRVIPSQPLPWVQLGGAIEVRIAAAWSAERMVPWESVLFSGEEAYVFVDQGEGRLVATPIQLGRRTRTHVEVADGPSVGVRVAASGTFLLSSEAHLRSALPRWRGAAVSDSIPSGQTLKPNDKTRTK